MTDRPPHPCDGCKHFSIAYHEPRNPPSKFHHGSEWFCVGAPLKFIHIPICLRYATTETFENGGYLKDTYLTVARCDKFDGEDEEDEEHKAHEDGLEAMYYVDGY